MSKRRSDVDDDGVALYCRRLMSFRLSPDVAAAVEHAAHELNISRAAVIDACVMAKIGDVVRELRAEAGSQSAPAAMIAFERALAKLKAEQEAAEHKLGLLKARRRPSKVK